MKLFFSFILIISVLFFSCSREKKNSDRGAGMLKDYPVVTLTPETVTVHQEFPATIEGQQVIEIRPMISGYIQEIYVNEGDHIRKGQLLFRIRNPMYEQQVNTAKASISRAEADVNTASMEIDKVKPLVDKEIVSEYRLRTAQLELESRNAALEQARAELANAEANLAYTVIRSPENGIIGTIPFKTGALVSSNMTQPLTTLSDITNVFAYFSWNEKQLLDFLSHSPGESMEEKMKNIPPATLILANATEYPEKGKIEMASGLISTETGSATFKAIFPNKNGLIRSGSSATVRVPEILDSVLVIPQSATYELQDKRFIYKVGDGNKVNAVSIIATPSDDGRHFFVTDGLAAGDRVVIEGVNSLKEGTEIIPKDTVQVISGIEHTGK
jgi:membrane fusion protein (multidrug efflux system)